MRIGLIFFTALFLAVGASAQSLGFNNVNYPGIYCRFSADCVVTPDEQYDSFMPTNVPASCVLMSRSFAGDSLDSIGMFGYEYQITIYNNTINTGTPWPSTNNVMVNALTLKFGEPLIFAFGGRASNEVWVVTIGGPDGLAPASATLRGDKITFSFDPPLTLQTPTDQTADTLVFGMMSFGTPQITTAILYGSAEDPINGNVPFKVKMQAQTP
jgi:hypothetical protein